MAAATVAVLTLLLCGASGALRASAFGDGEDATIRPQIVHGELAGPGEFPHQVSLQMRWRLFFWSLDEHFCGGSIVSARWVLTAGHCHRGPASTVIAVAGVNSLRRRDKAGAQVLYTDKFLVHEKYDGGVAPFDIGLVHTTQPFEFGDKVALALLPLRDEMPRGEATVSGWGYVSNGLFAGTHDLHRMTAPLLTLDACNATVIGMLPSWQTSPLADTNLCTEPGLGDAGICFGDSGGPLVQKGVDAKPTVIGVVSWASSHCGKVSVYTRVSAYIDWIAGKIEEDLFPY